MAVIIGSHNPYTNHAPCAHRRAGATTSPDRESQRRKKLRGLGIEPVTSDLKMTKLSWHVMFLYAKRIRTKVPGEYLRNANIAYINLRILPCAILMRATTAVQLQLYMYSAVVPVLSAISVYSCRCRDQVSHRTHWNTSTELLCTHTMSP